MTFEEWFKSLNFPSPVAIVDKMNAKICFDAGRLQGLREAEEVERLRARASELTYALETVEWENELHTDDWYCVGCDGDKDDGHYDWCPVGQALGRVSPSPDDAKEKA